MQEDKNIIYFQNLIDIIESHYTWKTKNTDLSSLMILDNVKRKKYDDFIYENKSLLLYDINSFLKKSDPEIILYLIEIYDTFTLKLFSYFNWENWLINDILEYRWYNGDTQLLLTLLKKIVSELKG